jgi:hypothetical protein
MRILRILARPACFVRIGAAQASGAWRPSGWRTATEREASASFDRDDASSAMRSALDRVLTEILPRRMISSPFVQVSLEGRLVLSAVIRFATLPKSASDRRLIISQRFCRDHRLEQSALDILGCSPTGGGDGAKKVLCLAAEKKMLQAIRETLAAKGLHSDVISAGYLLWLEQNKKSLEKPGVGVFDEASGVSIVLWDEKGELVHVASIEALDPEEASAQGAMMINRLTRYARILSAANAAPATIYADRLIADPFFKRVFYERGLKLLQWPAPTASCS